jgi:hypothetical protein
MLEYNNLEELKSKSRILDFDAEYTILKDKITSVLDSNPNCMPLFIAITGSVSYNSDTETSDLDAKIIYLQKDIIDYSQYNASNYSPQLITNVGDDITFYEIGRYIELLSDNNPNIIELLNTDEICVVYKHPLWDGYILPRISQNTLSKRCFYTFYNYSKTQKEKSKGLNKKITNPISKHRKSPLDFCYIIDGKSTTPLRYWLNENGYSQNKIGLTKVPNARDIYALYYDNDNTKKYKGIVKETDNVEVSNELRLSSISKEDEYIALLSYNKDGYTSYCRKYREYWGENGWINNRNEARYIQDVENGHGYDGIKLAHAVRLCIMARDIARTGIVVPRRSNEERDLYLKIRKGQMEFEDVEIYLESVITEMKDSFETSTLPETPDTEYLKAMLGEIRKFFL